MADRPTSEGGDQGETLAGLVARIVLPSNQSSYRTRTAIDIWRQKNRACPIDPQQNPANPSKTPADSPQSTPPQNMAVEGVAANSAPSCGEQRGHSPSARGSWNEE
ncbi:hypothetical protein E4U55_008132 [Claviceps digitariae]|nr:hypothetical protein E4U55_008132 [Claviceps digitariae]